MPDEAQHLAEANRHIAEGEERIVRQRMLLAALERDGHETQQGQELLRQLEQTLQQMINHRALIMRELGSQ